MIKLGELFDIKYGNQLDLNKLEITTGDCGINFISRQSYNLGVACKVIAQGNLHIFNEGDITVTLGGSYLLSSFIQQKPFYTGQNIKVLTPKVEMADIEKHFYCYVISKNRFRYTSHGREANKTLDDILVPNIDEIPSWIYTAKKFIIPSDKPYHHKTVSLNDREWMLFMYKDIFDIKKGFYNKKPISAGNEIPFVGATELNNGVTSRYSYDDIKKASRDGKNHNQDVSIKIFKGGEYVTISNNGSVGFCFFQKSDFTCSHDVNPTGLNDHQMNPFIAMFLCTVIHKEKFRWAYGRKWRPSRMLLSKIKLPVDSEGKPDWKFMEYYIKSLSYSSNLQEEKGQPDSEK